MADVKKHTNVCEKEQENSVSEPAKLTVMKTMTSNEMVITVEGKEGKNFRFSMPFYTPLNECYEACINAANEIARLFNEAIEQSKKEIAENAKKETK